MEKLEHIRRALDNSYATKDRENVNTKGYNSINLSITDFVPEKEDDGS